MAKVEYNEETIQGVILKYINDKEYLVDTFGKFSRPNNVLVTTWRPIDVLDAIKSGSFKVVKDLKETINNNYEIF